MNISKTDMKNVSGYAIGGAAMAALYQLCSIYASRRVLPKLDTEVDAIYHDQKLTHVLKDLEMQCKVVDPVAFIRAVDALDRLVFLRMVMCTEDSTMIPTSLDLDMALKHFTLFKVNMQRLTESVEERLEPRVIIRAQSTIKDVYESAQQHLATIVRRVDAKK